MDIQALCNEEYEDDPMSMTSILNCTFDEDRTKGGYQPKYIRRPQGVENEMVSLEKGYNDTPGSMGFERQDDAVRIDWRAMMEEHADRDGALCVRHEGGDLVVQGTKNCRRLNIPWGEPTHWMPKLKFEEYMALLPCGTRKINKTKKYVYYACVSCSDGK